MKKVIIIGGGFAGSYAAKHLEKHFDVLLIDTKDYFEFTPGILRTIVEPRHIQKLQVRHKQYLKKAFAIRGTAESITTKEVVVDKKKYPYDYLLVCAGSNYNLPIKEKGAYLAARGQHLLDAYDKVQNSKNILIAGGGLVGIELAAELATHFTDKNITLVHSKDRLIERNTKTAQRYVERFLRKHKVNILFNERLKTKKDGHYITEKGTKIEAGTVFMCTGIKPNSSFLQKFDDAVDEDNQAKVNQYMQVNSFTNIFAPGDINNIPIEKTAQNAVDQATIAVENIYRLEKGTALKNYTIKKTPLCISLGKHYGVLEIGPFVITGMFPAFVKWYIETTEMWKLKH